MHDYFGAALCRVSNSYRMRYRVNPGLYSLGSPTPETPVFVTANYKLSFDHLRKDLGAMDAWILVLDTKGINVWCAAGKGTFGTNELVRRIELEKLDKKVSHKNLIVPQLGAPGMAAHEVKKKTGFSVTYGPVRSKDLREFIANNGTSNSAMRTVTFTLSERIVLIPLEVVAIIKKVFIPLILIALVMGLQKQGIMFHQMAALVLPLVAALGTAIVAGCILHPVLLPFLFVRSFAFQGLILGILADILAHFSGVFSTMSIYGQFASYIAIPALSSYLAFNFTGSTPIANKSGVKKELKLSVPLYIAAGVATLILLVLYKISQEGLL
jgi:CO dehydrogenase/acetyl-CoA synthase gamma subunit (corrinoid Fe-S protein)